MTSKTEELWKEQIAQAVTALASAVRNLDDTRKKCATEWEKINALPQMAQVLELEAQTDEQRVAIKKLDHELRELVKSAFLTTGTKSFHPAATATEVKKLVITHEDKVMEWAAEHAPKMIAYSVDKRALKKVVDVLEIPGAHIETTPGVRIATDLSGYLPSAETDDLPF